jgi:hypothetical protein
MIKQLNIYMKINWDVLQFNTNKKAIELLK